MAFIDSGETYIGRCKESIMSDALVSIIIPVYNVEKFLYKCIKSVQNQTYRNIEIILVNDGSTDNSLEICKKFMKNDNRITLIDKENGGLSSARNSALDIINGEWIMFVDSDDYIECNMIENLVEAANLSNSDLTLCGYIMVKENEECIRKYIPEKKEMLSGIEALKRHYFHPGLINYVSAWGKLYKRDIWDELRFKKGLLWEDYDLMPYIYLKCKSVLTLPQNGYYYRQNKASITHNIDKNLEKFYDDGLMIVQQHIELYSDLELSELRNAAICILLNKIVGCGFRKNIPIIYENKSEKLFRKYYKIVCKNIKWFGLKRFLKYLFYDMCLNNCILKSVMQYLVFGIRAIKCKLPKKSSLNKF